LFLKDFDEHEKFTRLLLQHEPDMLRKVLVFVPQIQTAREIVQDTAVELWKHFHEYDPSRPFSAWAGGFALNQIRRRLRSDHRRRFLSEGALQVLADKAERTNRSSDAEVESLQECMGRLPEHHRQIIQGYYYDSIDVPALAASLNRSVDNVYKMLQRIRQMLADCVRAKMESASL
jgi:RNA polymerase sigma-70 factor, ECF subfamily